MGASGTVQINDASMEKSEASLEEALLMTGFGLYNIRHILLSGGILMGVIMQSLALGHVLPAARCDLHLDTQTTGLLAAVPFAAIVLTSYIWGWLADIRGRRYVMLLTMPVNVVLCLAASLAPEPVSFAVLVFLYSVFVSGPASVIYTYLGELNSPRHQDKIVTFGSSFIGTGTIVLPAISWLILPLEFSYNIPLLHVVYCPWRLLLFTCALPHALCSIVLYFSPESPKYLYSEGREEECLDVLKKIYAVNKWKKMDSFPVKSLIKNIKEDTAMDKKRSTGVAAVLVSMRDQTVPLFKKPLLRWTFLTCFVQFGLFAATNGFFVWFPTILNAMAADDGQNIRICDILNNVRNVTQSDVINGTTDGMEPCDATINTLAFEQSVYIGLVFTSMYFIIAVLVDFIGKKALLITTLVVTGLAGAVSPLVPSMVAVFLFAVLQMSGACVGLTNAVAVELFPTKYRALAVCLAMLIGRAGSMVGTNLIGFLLEANCELAFYVFGGLIVVNGLSCFILPGPTKEEKMSTSNNATS